MQPATAKDCQIVLFEGRSDIVQTNVNEFLRGQQDPTVVLVDVLYNYQGPEYDGLMQIGGSSSVGIGLVLQFKGHERLAI